MSFLPIRLSLLFVQSFGHYVLSEANASVDSTRASHPISSCVDVIHPPPAHETHQEAYQTMLFIKNEDPAKTEIIRRSIIDYLDALKKIAQLVVPPDLTVEIVPEGHQETFSILAHGERFVKSTDEPHVLAHEIAHLVIEETLLSLNFPFVQSLVKKIVNIKVDMRLLEEQIELIKNKEHQDLRSLALLKMQNAVNFQINSRQREIRAEAEMTIGQISRQLDRLRVQEEQMRSFFRSDFMVTFYEFMVDVLSYAYTGVDQFLYLPEIAVEDGAFNSKDVEIAIRARNFSAGISIHEWKNYFPYNENHSFFGPARSYVGTLFNDQDRETRMRLAGFIVKATLKHIETQMTSRNIDEVSPPAVHEIQSANQNLINAIKGFLESSY